MSHAAAAPSGWVVRFAPRVRPGGRMLDVAAGAGRHARLFLERGHPVTAIDRDVSRLPSHPLLRAVAADLEDGSPWPLAGERFDAVVVTNYLWRPLLPAIVDAVAPGGLLVYETFAAGNERFGKPSHPDFLLQPGELLEAMRGRLVVAAYEHGEVSAPRPAVIQRIAAVAEPA
jgi:SAM-dependent methyltransferase